jgi:hypothetical protein
MEILEGQDDLVVCKKQFLICLGRLNHSVTKKPSGFGEHEINLQKENRPG